MEITYEAIRKCPLFENLEEERFIELLSLFEEYELEDGKEIFQEGDDSKSLYFIAQGSVTLSRKSVGDDQLIFIELGEGEVFGEMSLIGKKTRSATAIAGKNTVIGKLSADDFAQLESLAIETYNSLHRKLNVIMCQRLTEATSNIVGMLSKFREEFSKTRGKDAETEKNQKHLHEFLQKLDEQGCSIFKALETF